PRTAPFEVEVKARLDVAGPHAAHVGGAARIRLHRVEGDHEATGIPRRTLSDRESHGVAERAGGRVERARGPGLAGGGRDDLAGREEQAEGSEDGGGAMHVETLVVGFAGETRVEHRCVTGE